MSRPLRILFVAPAYWPATAFGGPIPVMRELAKGLAQAGHEVDVLTTSLTEIGRRPDRATRIADVDGSTVRYLGTAARYRWFAFTPSLRRELAGLPRPDVVHVFGFRDYVGTAAAAWCRRRGIPYVLEPLGMFRPKLRKVRLKHVLDRTLYRTTPRGAALVIAASEVERQEVAAAVPPERIATRPNGFPEPHDATPRPGRLRRRLALDPDVPLVLAVGRVADGKGLDLLVHALGALDGAHLAIVGPDDGHGTTDRLRLLATSTGVDRRVHLLGAVDDAQPLYGDADVVALASAHENFGMVAAEAAAAGVASVVSDRCGVAELLRDRAALVVPYECAAVLGAISRLLSDDALRARLGAGGHAVAREHSWESVTAQQVALYERVT